MEIKENRTKTNKGIIKLNVKKDNFENELSEEGTQLMLHLLQKELRGLKKLIIENQVANAVNLKKNIKASS